MAQPDYDETKAAVKELVEMRNALVHNFIQRFDVWSRDLCFSFSLSFPLEPPRPSSPWRSLRSEPSDLRRSWSRSDWLALARAPLSSAALRLSGDPASTGAWALVVAVLADVVLADAALRDCASAGSTVAAARSVALMAAVAIKVFLSMV
jgi:hypothetical protein